MWLTRTPTETSNNNDTNDNNDNDNNKDNNDNNDNGNKLWNLTACPNGHTLGVHAPPPPPYEFFSLEEKKGDDKIYIELIQKVSICKNKEHKNCSLSGNRTLLSRDLMDR